MIGSTEKMLANAIGHCFSFNFLASLTHWSLVNSLTGKEIEDEMVINNSWSNDGLVCQTVYAKEKSTLLLSSKFAQQVVSTLCGCAGLLCCPETE